MAPTGSTRWRGRWRRAGAVTALVAVALTACVAPVPGTWAVADPPTDPPSTFDADLSCGAVDDCVAVSSLNAARDGLTATRWDGRTWTPLPDVPLLGVAGTGPHWANTTRVDCAGPTACAVVSSISGVPAAGLGTVHLLATWDGTAWTTAAAPPGLVDGQGLDVACGGPRACLAVGVRDRTTGERFAQRWDGGAWTAVPAPPTEPDAYRWHNRSRLSCATPTSCAYASNTFLPDMRTLTSVHRWDGAAWTATAPPLGVGVSGALLDIDCTTATRCIGVGWITNVGVVTVRGDGPSWTVESVDVVQAPLAAVSCAGERCLAVVVPSPGAGTPPRTTLEGLERLPVGWRSTTSVAADAPFTARALSCAGGRCVVIGNGPAGAVTLTYRY